MLACTSRIICVAQLVVLWKSDPLPSWSHGVSLKKSDSWNRLPCWCHLKSTMTLFWKAIGQVLASSMGIATPNHCPIVSWCTRQRTCRVHNGKTLQKKSSRTYSHHMIFACRSCRSKDRASWRKGSNRAENSVHAQTMSAPPRSSRLLRQFKAFSTCAHVGRTADFQPFPTHLTSLLQNLLPATSLSLLFWSHCLDEPSKTIWLWHFTSQLPPCAELSHSGNRSCRPSLSQGISSADRPARTARWFALQLWSKIPSHWTL